MSQWHSSASWSHSESSSPWRFCCPQSQSKQKGWWPQAEVRAFWASNWDRSAEMGQAQHWQSFPQGWSRRGKQQRQRGDPLRCWKLSFSRWQAPFRCSIQATERAQVLVWCRKHRWAGSEPWSHKRPLCMGVDCGTHLRAVDTHGLAQKSSDASTVP